MRRLLSLFLLAGALVPASASAGPVGSPYRFSDGASVVPLYDESDTDGGLNLASATNGYVLANWFSTTRVLGRDGRLGE